MINKLDLNALTRPSLEITLCDEARTTLHVTTPSEGLLQRMLATSSDLETLAKADTDPEVINKLYDLYAEVISCNTERQTVTGSELRDVYALGLFHLVAFAEAYLNFIQSIKNAKN